MSGRFVDDIRNCEFDQVLENVRRLKPAGCRILEIGAGTGLQARRFSEAGYSIDAIDLASSSYRDARVWPVVDYDGRHIPFPERSFDVVFSSSVLEHIPHLDEMQVEIARVLKDDGVAIHVVPGASWVLMSALTHYPYLLKLVFQRLLAVLKRAARQNRPADTPLQQQRPGRFTTPQLLMRVLMPPRHGERGIWLSEFWYFSKRIWIRSFINSGWEIRDWQPNGLCYSGNLILGPRLGIGARQRLGRLLFSVCHVFVLGKRAIS